MATTSGEPYCAPISEAGRKWLIETMAAFSITKYEFTERGFFQIAKDTTYVIPARELTKQESALADQLKSYPFRPENSKESIP